MYTVLTTLVLVYNDFVFIYFPKITSVRYIKVAYLHFYYGMSSSISHIVCAYIWQCYVGICRYELHSHDFLHLLIAETTTCKLICYLKHYENIYIYFSRIYIYFLQIFPFPFPWN